MPYVNPYPTNLPDVDEALTFAIRDAIRVSLDDLNAALNRDALSPMSLTIGQVITGDPEIVNRTLICVVGGGKDNGSDMEITPEFIPRTDISGYKILKFTNIYVYIGHKEMIPPNGDPELACQYRETARSRICGHLRKRVFNGSQGVNLQLTSQEFNTGTDFDEMLGCYVKEIKKGMARKGPGESIHLFSANLMHIGYIA